MKVEKKTSNCIYHCFSSRNYAFTWTMVRQLCEFTMIDLWTLWVGRKQLTKYLHSKTKHSPNIILKQHHPLPHATWRAYQIILTSRGHYVVLVHWGWTHLSPLVPPSLLVQSLDTRSDIMELSLTFAVLATYPELVSAYMQTDAV